MRDIRGDLQERANSAEEEIQTLYADCEKRIEQIKTECDAKVAKAKTKLEMLNKLIEFENEGMSNVAQEASAPGPPPLSRVVPPPNGSAAPTSLAQAIGFRKVS